MDDDDCIIVGTEMCIAAVTVPVSQKDVVGVNGRKLKQARLPFKPIELKLSNCPSRTVGSLKRRSIPDVPATQKPAKTFKPEVFAKTPRDLDLRLSTGSSYGKCIVIEDDRGVSSSCETTLVSLENNDLGVVGASLKGKDELLSSVQTLDRFLHRAAALEVSTNEGLEDGNEAEAFVKEIPIHSLEKVLAAVPHPVDYVMNEYDGNDSKSAVIESSNDGLSEDGLPEDVAETLRVENCDVIVKAESCDATLSVKSDATLSVKILDAKIEKDGDDETGSCGSSPSTNVPDALCSTAVDDKAGASLTSNDCVEACDADSELKASKVNAVKRQKVPFTGVTKHIKPSLAAKIENERRRAEEKEKREKEKNEMLLKKAKEKQDRENERAEKKRLKEEERLKKLELAEEERKKKEEMKLEEKKKKEEERKKKEEEKPEPEKVSAKEKELMQKFFFKPSKDLKVQTTAVTHSIFKPFEVKKDMRLAPICRVNVDADLLQSLETQLQSQNTSVLYIEELRKKVFCTRRSGKTWPFTSCLQPTTVSSPDVEVVESAAETLNDTAKIGTLMKAKLFQFHENYRPAYYGTWRKRSARISGRHPLHKDEGFLDYEVESDDEWEEEEPGESLSHSEGENDDEPEGDDEGDDEDEEGDGFFVPHGYLSEDECGDDEEDVSPEKLKAQQLAKAHYWEAEMKSKRCEVLKPICIGICWMNDDRSITKASHIEKLKEFQMILFEPVPISVGTKVKTKIPDSSQEKVSPTSQGKVKKSVGANLMPVPDSALPHLVRLVHGNKCGIDKLIHEFQTFWRQSRLIPTLDGDTALRDSAGNVLVQYEKTAVTDPQSVKDGNNTSGSNAISKRQLGNKIREIASYISRPECYRGKLWFVNDTVLQTLGLTNLPVPTQWKWSSKEFNDDI